LLITTSAILGLCKRSSIARVGGATPSEMVAAMTALAIERINPITGYSFCWDAEYTMLTLDLAAIRCVVFDFGFTLSSDLYFTLAPPLYPHWRSIIQQHIFEQPPLVTAWMRGDLSLHDIAQIVA
jgi:hypothetical protein